MCMPCDPVKKLVLQEADQADENGNRTSNSGDGNGSGNGGGNNASGKNGSNINGNANGKVDEFKYDDDKEMNNCGSGVIRGKIINP